MSMAAGSDILTHCSFTGPQPLSASVVQQIAKWRIPCAALLETGARVAWWRDNRPAWLPEYSDMMQVQHLNNRALIQAGAVLAMATDGGGYSPFEHDSTRENTDESTRIGEAAMLWLQAAQELGMTPMDALLSATRNVAAAYRMSGDLGTLEPGKIADFVVLEGDPLADVRNYRRIHAILKAGRFVDLDALPASPTGQDRPASRAAAAASR